MPNETAPKKREHLSFKVAPHIVEDLGLNLYTDLPRVLVEYVANAYDADSPKVELQINKVQIDEARKRIKADYDHAKAIKAEGDPDPEPLEIRRLPDDISIVITDYGHGMSENDLDCKFLVAGRRRRKEEQECSGRSPAGRLLMGRKGLGKLAGYGVARRVVVESRRSGEPNVHRITLDFDLLNNQKYTHEIKVPLSDAPDADFPVQGTRVTLSQLLYEPTKSRESKIESEIMEHFAYISPEEFSIHINGKQHIPDPIAFDFAWPAPEKSDDDFEVCRLPVEGHGEVEFKYRLRFRPPGKYLPAARRGIRVYAHNRLAAAPSLLDAKTNMHGFRNTDYLDGVVIADFIDDQPAADYIATDRQSLRWDAPLLSPMRTHLSEEIQKACFEYQSEKERRAPDLVKSDDFTNNLIFKHGLEGEDKRLAYKMATALAAISPGGLGGNEYQTRLTPLVGSISKGLVYQEIVKLAESNDPDLNAIINQTIRLTKNEYSSFITTAKTRVKAIDVLERIIQKRSFGEGRHEKEVQHLLEECPWLIDPTFTQFISADRPMSDVLGALEKELQIGRSAPSDARNNRERPDLVFLGLSQVCW